MTVTVYAALLGASGLSQREAAEFHGVRLDTVKSWSAGRNRPPSGAIQELSHLVRQQMRAASEADALIRQKVSEHGTEAKIQLGVSSDDAEARSLGWPCVSAHERVVALIATTAISIGLTVAIVPRGSTPETAAAADIHGR